MLENVRDRVKSGELLSDSFAAQAVFPKIYTTTLLAGEKSGNMEEVLGRYIAFQRLASTFKKKLVVSLVYPSTAGGHGDGHDCLSHHLCRAAVRPLFQNLDAQLPAITLLMLNIGTHAQKYAPAAVSCWWW